MIASFQKAIKCYTFTLVDDLLGWDTTGYYLSDLTADEITALWEMSKDMCYSKRIEYIKSSAQSLSKTFEPIKIEKSFSM